MLLPQTLFMTGLGFVLRFFTISRVESVRRTGGSFLWPDACGCYILEFVATTGLFQFEG